MSEKIGWKHNAYHIAILAICAVVCVWLYWQPKSGKAVLVIGGLAILMLLADLSPNLKAAYVVVVIGLMLAENHALNKERADTEKERIAAIAEQGKRAREENDRFSEIAEGLKSAIKTNQDEFAETMRRFEGNVNTITGGDSFAIVTAPFIPVSAPTTFQLTLQVRGRYDLQDVHVEVVRLPEPGFGTQDWAMRTLAGKNPYLKAAELGNISHRSGRVIPITVDAVTDGGTTEYSINVFARNRMTHESLRIKKDLEKNEWESSFKIIDGESHRILAVSKPEWLRFAFGSKR